MAWVEVVLLEMKGAHLRVSVQGKMLRHVPTDVDDLPLQQIWVRRKGMKAYPIAINILAAVWGTKRHTAVLRHPTTDGALNVDRRSKSNFSSKYHDRKENAWRGFWTPIRPSRGFCRWCNDYKVRKPYWRWAYTFPLPKIRTFRFSLHTSRLSLHGEVTMVALKFAMSSHFPLPKIFSPSGFVPPLSNGTSRDEWSKTQDKWSNLAQSYFVLPIEKLNQINTKNYWNEKKRLCVRWLGVINLTWENLQIAKHKSGRRLFSSADLFVLCDL